MDTSVAPQAGWWNRLRGELTGGLSAAAVTLPITLSAGLLAYAPFGPEYSARGAIAGLLGAAAAAFAALSAPSSFMISSPRAGVAIVQSGLAATLLVHPLLANIGPAFHIFAMAACLLLAGLWQMVFGLLGIGRLIKFTPQAVLAGFINGIAVLVLVGALKILLTGAHSMADVIARLTFGALTAGVVIVGPRLTRQVPAPLLALAIGSVAYYALHELFPGVLLGRTVGEVSITIDRILERAAYRLETYGALLAVALHIVQTSLVLAAVASLESLLIVRLARQVASVPGTPRRVLISQGVGNCVSAILGGVAMTAGPSQSMANFRAGGRTRLSAIIAAVLLLLIVFVPSLLGAIPLPVLAAMLFAAGLVLFDPWSVNLLRGVVRRQPDKDSRGTYKTLAIVVVVTAVTVAWSVAAGLITGVVLSAVMFIIHMSRPLVRQRFRGDAILSQRVRPQRDIDILRRDGRQRAVLRLQGVMFFGNTDDLVDEIDALWTEVDTVVLDFRRVADIDISAADALQVALVKARTSKKTLLFCSVPPPHVALFESFAEATPGGDKILFGNLDKALEAIEDTVLRAEGPSLFEEIPLERLEFFAGLSADEIAVIEKHLTPMCFPAGTALCRQGDPADFMWILSCGSVSVWIDAPDGQPGRRIAALARGTIVGEMSLLEGGTRTATVRADEDVTGYVVDRAALDTLLAEHPRIATALLANIARETVRRLRATSLMVGNDAA